MYYNYDEEKRDLSGGDISGDTPPAPIAPEPTQSEPHTGSELYHGSAQTSESSDTAASGSPAEPKPAAQPVYNAEVSRQAEAEKTAREPWSEPSYRVPENDENMYTPGLNTHQYYSKRKVYDSNTPERQISSKRRVGFIKAACLVLSCMILSSAAAYGVLELRIRKGDFKPVNQVVLGGSGGSTTAITPAAAGTGEVLSGEEIYERACEQVVGINTEVTNVTSPGGFFGQPSTSTGSGSGFIISEDGYILTNYHVIEMAYRGGVAPKVILHDGTGYEAKIIGFEPSNDIAVIKIETTGLKAVVLGNSDEVRVGQTIYAVGNTLGELVYSMTDGIVSGLNRTVTFSDRLVNTFQMNAAISFGNSGGPVYNTKGEVIGIATGGMVSAATEGINFAIPINDAIGIALDLVENGYITGRAFMGVTAETFTKAYAEFYASAEGAYIMSVTPGSAAEKAGIKIGDIVTKLGDVTVTSKDSLQYAKNKFKAGDTATLTVWRSGEYIELTITFDEDLTRIQQQSSQPQQITPAP